jgi:hypothetical protein
MLLVSGVAQIFDYLNNLYTNLPKLFAILSGSNPDFTAAWAPIGLSLGLSLQVRIVLFIILVAFAFFINNKANWYSNKPNQQGKQLGIFSGALTALIWSSAATTFWRESIADGSNALPAALDNVLAVFPDVTSITPWLITVFFVIVVIGIVLNLPKLVKA